MNRVGLCETAWAGLPLDTPFFVRARAVDLAGNATGWRTAGASVTVASGEGPEDTGDTDDTGEDDAGGSPCSTTPGVALGLWTAVALLGLQRRRR